MNIIKYFRRQSSLAYLPTNLEDSTNLMHKTSLFQTKIFIRKTKETTATKYLIAVAVCPTLT